MKLSRREFLKMTTALTSSAVLGWQSSNVHSDFSQRHPEIWSKYVNSAAKIANKNIFSIYDRI